MAVVYVREQGSVVRKRGGRMLVEKDQETLLEIPLRDTDAVAVFGNVQVTTQALSELLERGIPLALYTRYGRLKGHLEPEASKNAPLRMAQYRAVASDAVALSMSKEIVRAKLCNAAELVSDYRAHYPSAELRAAVEALRDAAAKSRVAASHGEVLGMEGAGAARYFEAFAKMNRSDLPFDGRRRRPAPDPINALLSLGYTMVMNELRSLAEGAGLEPLLGFLHKVDYGRPSLALDLMEAFRAPVVDRLTLRLVNERILTGDDFGRRVAGQGAGGIVLVPDSLRKYLEYYEGAMTEPRAQAVEGIRAVMRAQAAEMARAIREGSLFKPWLDGDGCCT